MVVVAQACRDVVVGGDVVLLLFASMGIHVTKEDMGLLGRESALVGELVEELFYLVEKKKAVGRVDPVATDS